MREETHSWRRGQLGRRHHGQKGVWKNRRREIETSASSRPWPRTRLDWPNELERGSEGKGSMRKIPGMCRVREWMFGNAR